MKIVFRVDSSLQMGSGHLMRCLTLASELKKKRADLCFICRDLPGNVARLIEKSEMPLHFLPYSEQMAKKLVELPQHQQWLGDTWQNDVEQTKQILQKIAAVDWLVVDHYALDFEWERATRDDVKNVMVIDDLADRRHDCDLILDQNLYENMAARYDNLVPEGCRKLLGPEYSLLRSEFAEWRKHVPSRNGKVKRIVIFFGNSDPTNETTKAIKAINKLHMNNLQVDVVVGSGNSHKQLIADLCESLPGFNYHCQIDNMAELFANADLAIGAGGTTTWERCCLGLSSLVISVAKNQERLSIDADKINILRYLGKNDAVDVGILSDALKKLINNKNQLIAMSANAMSLVDGLGCARVVKQMQE